MYNLEIRRVIDSIKKNNAKSVLLQLPDGLKPKAKEIHDNIKKEVDVKIFIYAGSCFGACDTPITEAKYLKVDLLVQWGHSEWR